MQVSSLLVGAIVELRHPVLLAAGLMVMALLLCFGFLQYRTNSITFYTDGTISRTVETDAIFPTGMQIIDLGCFVGLQCTRSAIHHIPGVYARGNLGRPVAIIGGLLAPCVLLCMAGYVIFKHVTGIARILVSAALILLAAFLTAPLAIAAYGAFVI